MSALDGGLVPQPAAALVASASTSALSGRRAGYCRAANIFSLLNSFSSFSLAELLMFDICFGFIFNVRESRSNPSPGGSRLAASSAAPSTWGTSVDAVIQKLIAWIEWQQLAECGRVLPKC